VFRAMAVVSVIQSAAKVRAAVATNTHTEVEVEGGRRR
jgi:hypothetical protein